jgi:hypothetical protein
LGHNGELGQGLAALGIDLTTLLGPDGTVSSDLNTLLGETGLNKIEQEALSHQISTQIANAKAYKEISDAENGTPTKVNKKLETEFTNLKSKLNTLNDATNKKIAEGYDVNGYSKNKIFKNYEDDLETLAKKVRQEEE